MGLLFRLSVVVFVYLVFGLAMFWLSVGIVGKKVKAVQIPEEVLHSLLRRGQFFGRLQRGRPVYGRDLVVLYH